MSPALKLKAILELRLPVFSVELKERQFTVLVTSEADAETLARFFRMAGEFGEPQIKAGPRLEDKSYWQVVAVADSEKTLKKLVAA